LEQKKTYHVFSLKTGKQDNHSLVEIARRLPFTSIWRKYCPSRSRFKDSVQARGRSFHFITCLFVTWSS